MCYHFKEKNCLTNINKNKLGSTLLLLTLAVSIFLVALPFAEAAVRIRTPYDTFAYISANPSPIGVGQQAIVTFRIDQPLAGASVRSGLANGTTVIITRPDGTTETKGPITLDSTSSGWLLY